MGKDNLMVSVAFYVSGVYRSEHKLASLDEIPSIFRTESKIAYARKTGEGKPAPAVLSIVEIDDGNGTRNVSDVKDKAAMHALEEVVAIGENMGYDFSWEVDGVDPGMSNSVKICF